MRDLDGRGPPVPLQRQLVEREQVFRDALALPLEVRRDLATSLLWSLPRDEVTSLNVRLSTMLQKDIIGSLPPELAFLILAKLDLSDILSCALVSTKWRKLCEEQALWALLCASHSPPIRPSHPSWADLTHHRSLLNRRPRTPPDDSIFEEAPYGYDYDERYGHSDPFAHAQWRPSSSSDMGSGRLDPLGMAGGLRHTVWERGIGSSGTGLPTHLQSTHNASTNGNTSSAEPPVSSHLAVPSAKPQANYKHLYIVHHILLRRMTTPRPFGPAACLLPSGQEPVMPIPKVRTIDAISSVKAGGLPGHSEAIYSLALIHHTMKINMLTSCHDCSSPIVPSSAHNDPAASVFDSLLALTAIPPSPSSSRKEYGAFGGSPGPLMPGQKLRTVDTTVQGREWLLSGSRDKTLRLWQLGTPEPRVVKVFSGGHSGSVLTHSVVKVPARSFLARSTSTTSPSKFNTTVANLSLSPDDGSKQSKGEGRSRLFAVSGGSDGKICLWDIEGNGQPEKVVQAHEESVLCVRADDGKVVSCSKDKTIKLFDIRTLEQLLVIGGTGDELLHRGAVNAVGLTKDYIISAAGDKTLRVWSIETGDMLFCVEAHQRGIASIDLCLLSPAPFDVPRQTEGEVYKGTIVSSASDASIKIFHLVERQGIAPPPLSGHDLGDEHGSSGRDAGDEDRVMAEDGESDLSFREMMDPAVQAGSEPVTHGLSVDGKRVSLVLHKTMRAPCTCPPGLTRPDSVGCRRCGNRGHADLVRSVSLGHEVVVSGSYDSKVKVWHRATGQHLVDLSGAHSGRIYAVCSDKAKVISSGLDCRINIWDFGEALDTSFVEL